MFWYIATFWYKVLFLAVYKDFRALTLIFAHIGTLTCDSTRFDLDFAACTFHKNLAFLRFTLDRKSVV